MNNCIPLFAIKFPCTARINLQLKDQFALETREKSHLGVNWRAQVDE